MMDGLDVVAIRIEHERGIVAGVVMAFARRAVIATARCNGRRMKTLHRVAIGRLEGEVHVRDGRSVVDFAHEDFSREEIAVAFATQLAPERLQYGPIEALARNKIGYDDLDVIDQPAEMKIHDAFLWGSLVP